MDATLFRSLVVSFIVCFIALTAIFNIFTLFELWRFIPHSCRYRSGRKVSVVPDAAHDSGTISGDDADFGLGYLCVVARRHEAIAWWASAKVCTD